MITRVPPACRSARTFIAASGLLLAAGVHAQSAALATAAVPVMAAAASEPATAADQPLAIKRITLYRSGVGAFERRGKVDGAADVQLRFPTEQINDILKSMFVLDKAGGVEGIRYGSKDPLSKRLSSFGIDISDNPSANELLSRLRGTAVKINSPKGVITGVVMNVETRPTIYAGGDKATAAKFDLPWINLLTEKGVRSINLTAVTGFEIADPALAGELQRALAAVAEYRADRTKTVEVAFGGTTDRDVVIGYIHEMPVWKTSYRLILPEPAKAAGAAAADATIQGWALVENTTDEDWKDVALGLVSGRPVSFQMDLYEPLYVFRPMVPVPTVPGVMPREYDAAQLALEVATPEQMARLQDGEEKAMKRGSTFGTPSSPPARHRSAGAGGGGFGGGGSASDEAPAASAGFADRLESGNMAGYAPAAAAQAMESGEVFQYELKNPITLERQKSAMLPILTAAIPARRVSIFNRTDAAKNPMRGVEITNTSGMQLIPGPITVFDGAAYAGDAQIGHVSAGDKRLLAYAVDLEVEASTEENQSQDIRKIRIVNGMLEQTLKRVATVSYNFSNKDQARGRTMIVEQPRMQNWDLVEPKSATEKTEAMYRFEIEMPAHKAAPFKVVQERVELQRVGLTDIGLPLLVEFSKQGKVSDAVVKAVQEAARRRTQITEAQATVARLQAERQQISKDQERVRQNMTTVGQQAEIYARYLQKFTEQENRIEAVDSESKKLQGEIARMEAELNEYLRTLNVE